MKKHEDGEKEGKMKGKFFFTHNEADIIAYLNTDVFFDFIDLRDDDGNTVLHFATNYNNFQMVQKYVSRIQDPAYWKAVKGQQLTPAAIKFRIKQWINESNREGLTAMHYACLKGHIPIIAFLQNNGGNIQKTTEKGHSMLHLAVKGESLKTVIFLRGKINLNIRDEREATPLHWACYFGNISIANYFLADPEIEVDPQDQDGNTPLHLAVKNCHIHIVESLLMKGAQTTIQSKKGLTARENIQSDDEGQKIEKLFCQYSQTNCTSQCKRTTIPLILPFFFVIIFLRIAFFLLSLFPSTSPTISLFNTLIIISAELFSILIILILLALLIFSSNSEGFAKVQSSSYCQYSEKDLSKLCFYCGVRKDAEITHCHICQKCVKKQIQHSKYLSECIREGNIKLCQSFFIFLTLYLGYVFGCGVWMLGKGIKDDLKKENTFYLVCMGLNLVFFVPFLFCAREATNLTKMRRKKWKKNSLLSSSNNHDDRFSQLSKSLYLEQENEYSTKAEER